MTSSKSEQHSYYPGSRDGWNIVSSHKCEGLFRESCECQAELGDIARIDVGNFVSSFKFVMCGGPLWDLCECQCHL